jgi:hypothetical protein
MKKTRDQQRRRAANKAFREARRPRRPKLVMVPAAGDLEDVDYEEGERVYGKQRAVLVPFKPTPIYWETAREIGKAYARVLDGEPKWDKTREAEIVEEHNKVAEARKKLKGRKPIRLRRTFKGVTIQRREPKGEWWMSRFADLVDRRVCITKPGAGYKPREIPEAEPDAKPDGTEAAPPA